MILHLLNIILIFSLISNSYSSAESYSCEPKQNHTGEIYDKKVDFQIIREKFIFNNVEYKYDENDFSETKQKKNLPKEYRDTLPDFWLKQINEYDEIDVFLALNYAKPTDNKTYIILAELYFFIEEDLKTYLTFHCNYE